MTQTEKHKVLPPSCVVRKGFTSSSAQGTGDGGHALPLNFAHENPLFEFYLLPSPIIDDDDNNNNTDNSLASQNNGASLAPLNTQVKSHQVEVLV